MDESVLQRDFHLEITKESEAIDDDKKEPEIAEEETSGIVRS